MSEKNLHASDRSTAAAAGDDPMAHARMECQIAMVAISQERNFLNQVGQPLSPADQKYLGDACQLVTIDGADHRGFTAADGKKFVAAEVAQNEQNQKDLAALYKKHPELKPKQGN